MTRIAVIGTRGHLNEVIDGIPLVEDCALVGMAPADEGDDVTRFSSHAAWTGDTRAFDDYRVMLEEVRPDVVCVCMHYHRNAEAAIEAAGRGIDILCEKPVATTLEDLGRLRKAVSDNGIRISALFGMRLLPEFQAVRKIVTDGEIGEPLLAFGQKSYRWGSRPAFYRERATYGGTIPWVAIHAIDFIRYCSGVDYASVRALHANKTRPDYPGCEDCGGLLFEFANGGQAVVTFDYLRPEAAGSHGDDRLRIAGSEGVVEVRLDDGYCKVMTKTEGPRELALEEKRSFFVDYMEEVRGGEQHVVGADEAIRVTEIALLAREAADSGRTIDLK